MLLKDKTICNIIGFNDFPTFYPELATEWNYEKKRVISIQFCKWKRKIGLVEMQKL